MKGSKRTNWHIKLTSSVLGASGAARTVTCIARKMIVCGIALEWTIASVEVGQISGLVLIISKPLRASGAPTPTILLLIR